MRRSSFQDLYYPETRFGGFTRFDGTINFYARVNSLIARDSIVLDIGCGRGVYRDDRCRIRRDLRDLRGKAGKVIGIDVDTQASVNPFLDEFRLIDSTRWPVETASIDLAIADYVLEHVEDPHLFFNECARLIKPGGYFCFRTPNAWGYVAVISRLLPNRYHAGIAVKVQSERKHEDVFPTYYRCNTVRALRRHLRQSGFDTCVYAYEAEPSYFEFSRLLYYVATLHQKFAPDLFKLALFGFARRRDEGSG